MSADWRTAVLRVAQRLDQLNYFQLLNLKQDASGTEIRGGFRRLAQHYHPDRLGGMDDPELHQAVSAIYRRITEAYSTLRNPITKAAYIEGLEGGELRLDTGKVRSRSLARKKAEEPGKTEAGKRHYQAALAALEKGDLRAAKSEIRSALLFERDEPGFQALLKRIESG
ncbi:MAG: hypothetical protein CMH55_04310 [Myxococcales bacterium]|nr:hypothetical protein [Myxococcales bacterium]